MDTRSAAARSGDELQRRVGGPPARWRHLGPFWLLAVLAAWLAAAGPGAAQGAASPHGSLEEPCENCHTLDGWTELRDPLAFDHSEATGFALERGHSEVSCMVCHDSLEFSHVAAACADCHVDSHLGELGAACESCHDPAGWSNRGRMSDLHSATLFPLTGAHDKIDCESCHDQAPPFEFRFTPTDCFSCHQADYQATTEPDHQGAGFSTSCEDCHSTTAWNQTFLGLGADFDHDLFFPLEGAHAAVGDCGACHRGGVFAGTPRDCFSCHTEDYERTTDPNHLAAGFPTACESCHGTSAWTGAEFEHASFWVLRGAHRAADCSSCHLNGVYAGTPTDCFDCHDADYQQSVNPDHRAAGFSTDCASCHNERDFAEAEFDHGFWALRGRHRAADCQSCHQDGVYAGTSDDCFSCHRADYRQTTNPDHEAAGFPTACENCHVPAGWDRATDFDHDALFALTGAHRPLDCEACHVDGVFSGTPRDCYSCHRDDYDRTADPDHAAAGFPTMCEACHDTTRWTGAEIDHDAFWPLTGAHRPLDCDSCHGGGVFAGTPTDCYSCHRDDYDRTTDPDHAAAGFPTMCEACHDTSDWDATFDHAVFWPLTGQHRSLDCDSCHAGGVFAGTPTDCYSCHRDDYDRTTDPDHAAAGFPTMCESCHDTGGWEGADFEHAAFPIDSGDHRSPERLECSECHVNPNNFQVFECILCHEHRQSEMDDEHDDVPGYIWESMACYSCHPDGRE